MSGCTLQVSVSGREVHNLFCNCCTLSSCRNRTALPLASCSMSHETFQVLFNGNQQAVIHHCIYCTADDIG